MRPPWHPTPFVNISAQQCPRTAGSWSLSYYKAPIERWRYLSRHEPRLRREAGAPYAVGGALLLREASHQRVLGLAQTVEDERACLQCAQQFSCLRIDLARVTRYGRAIEDSDCALRLATDG